ncbi:PDDEXK nuclease domain-containing protein [Fluviispira multicolorata]|uniref:DUF1016 family protein n=1 Tax=Fluviispira multicolorata TaxID=2654512 RepID=A0A833JFZ1_9BACT|nr:PDDEXK nuclease domain-containing protein [Fluviispira multicolorata]KAB8033590.1 DUF1016 family protein [Fluviispira multicolorata]
MSKSNLDTSKNKHFFDKVFNIIFESKKKIITSVNTLMLQSYWHIGKTIIEEEQKGKKRAEYGKSLIESLSKELSEMGEKGFDVSNLWKIRKFYLAYPILDALRLELSWTHYRQLLRIEDKEKRSFYEVECLKSRWSTRELERQLNSMLYERLALSRDKAGIMEMAQQGAEPFKASDIVKDPFVLEFLGLKENERYLEKDLENALIQQLQNFLLELGRGFSFIARQKRLTIDGDHFYVDLVFYHYILKCFVLIDLKIGKLMHQDLGQMQMYVNFYEKELTLESDNPPIGIVLCSDKNDAVVKYTLSDSNKKIFASKYKLQLPTEEELKQEIIREKSLILLKKED